MGTDVMNDTDRKEFEGAMKKHVDYLFKGNQEMIKKAIEFFDSQFLPALPANAFLTHSMHSWLEGFKKALFERDVSDGTQKIYLLDRIVHHSAVDIAQIIVCRYLKQCAPGQQHDVMQTLTDLPALYYAECIHALLPAAPLPLPADARTSTFVVPR